MFLCCICILTVWGKIEILPLPVEEQECFDKERVHGDLSQIIGQVVLEKCLYGTEIKKLGLENINLPKPTVNWINGLIEQTLHESKRQSNGDVPHTHSDVKIYRGKRQAGQAGQPQTVRIRKEYRMLLDDERNRFHRAIQMLKADTVS